MDDFSLLAGLLGYVDSTEEVEPNSLHAQEGIGKEGKIVTICATFIKQIFLPNSSTTTLALHLVFSLLIRKVKQH